MRLCSTTLWWINRSDAGRLPETLDLFSLPGGLHVKFKLIFVLFNIVIVLSFLVIYLMPLFMLGWEYTQAFWSNNWGLPIIFLGIIGILNGYFVFNWKLFRLLEREEWDGLILHLEHRMYDRKIVLVQQVRILVNAYLVRSDLAAVSKLENFIRDSRKKVLPRVALVLGVPHLLRQNSDAMESYFAAFTGTKVRDRFWLKWCFAFSLVLGGKKDEAVTTLTELGGQVKEPVLLLLCAYLLQSLDSGSSEVNQVVELARAKLTKRFSQSTWEAEVERSKNRVQVVIMSRLVDDATTWLFSNGSAKLETDPLH